MVVNRVINFEIWERESAGGLFKDSLIDLGSKFIQSSDESFSAQTVNSQRSTEFMERIYFQLLKKVSQLRWQFALLKGVQCTVYSTVLTWRNQDLTG